MIAEFNPTTVITLEIREKRNPLGRQDLDQQDRRLQDFVQKEL